MTNKKKTIQRKHYVPRNAPKVVIKSPPQPSVPQRKAFIQKVWGQKNKFLVIFVTLVVITAAVLYFFSQEGIVQHIIGSTIGGIATLDLALTPLIFIKDIKAKLMKRLELSENAYLRSVVTYLGIINVSILFIMLSIAILTPIVQNEEIHAAPISGKVLCVGHEPVEGIWVDADNYGSGFADWYASSSDGSEAAFKYVLPNGGNYNLHVGCGGSRQNWKSSYNTESGTGIIKDYTFHYFLCQDIPLNPHYGSCRVV